MKRLWILLVLVMLLCGCSAQQTFETVMDALDAGEIDPAKKIMLELPKDAAVTTMESADGGVLYMCDGYTLSVQTLAGGDLSRTLKQITGYTKEQLTMMQTKAGQAQKYSCVWTAAGEGGDQIGRAVILDDGSYHYCVTVMADAAASGDLIPTWQDLLASVSLSTD